MNKVILILHVIICFSLQLNAQTYSPSQNLNFVNYLSKNNNATDIKVFYYSLDKSSFNKQQLDSLNFYYAWSNYFTKDFDSAITYFDKIDYSSSLYPSSLFHNVFCSTYQGKYIQAHQKLTLINDSLGLNGFKRLNTGAIYLLERNYTAFDSVSKNFNGMYYQFKNEELELLRISKELKKEKRKSPLKALALSAVVPGLGKYYAGYWGKAVSTFLPVMVFGTMAAESFYRAGPKSPQFIILGSLFSAFYLGNLYGTYYSVRIHQNELDKKHNNEILLNVHIPLRRIFNQ